MANIENIVDAYIWKNLDDRKYIQTKIAALIATNTFDNNLLEIIDTLYNNKYVFNLLKTMDNIF